MATEIVRRESHPKGMLYRVRIDGHDMDFLFLFHAMERMKKWQISDKMVKETLLLPEEVTMGHRGRFIAHRRYGNHLIRAVYEYQKGLPVLVTVYFLHSDRYFKGGNVYEDKIFKGS